MAKFRKNVACVLKDGAGRILVCERADLPGCWQFPQGGVKPKESLREALIREVEEEISLRKADYSVDAKAGPYRYLFPEGFKKGGCDGQEQTLFLCSLLCSPDEVNVDTAEPEFRAVRWVEPKAYRLEWTAPMKREFYSKALREFFGVVLNKAESAGRLVGERQGDMKAR